MPAMTGGVRICQSRNKLSRQQGWAWRSHGKPAREHLGPAAPSVLPHTGGPGTTGNTGMRGGLYRVSWPAAPLAMRGEVGSGPGVLKPWGPVAQLPGESVHEHGPYCTPTKRQGMAKSPGNLGGKTRPRQATRELSGVGVEW